MIITIAVAIPVALVAYWLGYRRGARSNHHEAEAEALRWATSIPIGDSVYLGTIKRR